MGSAIIITELMLFSIGTYGIIIGFNNNDPITAIFGNFLLIVFMGIEICVNRNRIKILEDIANKNVRLS